MLTVAVISAPVAWNHHFGVIYPVLAAMVPLALPMRAGSGLLVSLFFLGWIGIGTAVQIADPLFESPWTGLLGSQIFFGGQLLFVALLLWQWTARRTAGAVAGPRPPETLSVSQ